MKTRRQLCRAIVELIEELDMKALERLASDLNSQKRKREAARSWADFLSKETTA